MTVAVDKVRIRSIFDLKPVHDRISARMEIGRVIEYMRAHIGGKITKEPAAMIYRKDLTLSSSVARSKPDASIDYFLHKRGRNRF